MQTKREKIKNIVVTISFVAFMVFLVAMCVVKYFNPSAESESERRPLAQFPNDITFESVINKDSIDKFEDYSVDQFPFREFFRNIKANFQMYFLGLKENNGLAVEDGYIAKIEDEFNASNVEYSIGRLEYIYNTYIKDKAENTYLSIIPDKNYFFGEKYGYVTPDYKALIEELRKVLGDTEYIDIFSSLELEDFYKTDTHWSQDKLSDVLLTLGDAMGFSENLSGKYEEHTEYPFLGVYHGQSALNPAPDTITYLSNEYLDSMTVFDYLDSKTYSIYNFEKLEGKDGYEFFLSGTRPLLRIDNPLAKTDKELVIFRDSFGSSISPLIAEGYKTVYVVDIRYVGPKIVDNMIDFEEKDVLFLYSAMILNTMSFLNQP